jgi:hypothetical protein
MQFGSGVSGGGSGNQQYSIYPIAGLQCTAGGSSLSCQQPTSLVQAQPTAVYTATVDASQLQTLENGLTATKLFYNDTDDPAHAVGTIGFLSSLANYSGGQLVSGAQQVSLYVVSNTQLMDSRATAVGQINSVANWQPVTTIEVCFTSGTTKQSGKVTIGTGNGSQTAVNVKIYSTTTCT